MVTGISGAILAGGTSRRMGMDKANLVVGGQTMLARAVATLASVCDEVSVVISPGATPPAPLPTGVTVARDRVHDAGPLAGLEAALMAASHDPVLVVAVDMPGLDAAVLHAQLRMAVERPEIDVVTLPGESTGSHEPLHAVYRRRVLGRVTALLDAGERRMATLLAGLRVADLDLRKDGLLGAGRRSARNMNTPAALDAYLATDLLKEVR
jgi:molybdopterin-guanine dinucleotide biosynthesis protein A